MRPAESIAVAVAINNPDFTSSMKSMLLRYEDLPTVLTQDGVNLVRFGARKQLMIDSFGLLELIVQTKRVFKTSDSVAVQATLYICTSEGYQPVFSRLGYASEDELLATSTHSNVVGFAESNAEKRILQALGMPDVKPSEAFTLRGKIQANIVKINSFLKKQSMTEKELVDSFNSTSNTQITTLVMNNLTTVEADDLVTFINEAGL